MRGWLFVALLLTGCLFALTGLRQFFIDPVSNPITNTIWFALQVAPLAMILPGLLRLHTRACFYTIMVAMLYFIHGVMGVMSTATQALRWTGIWELVFSCLLIAVATWLLRLARARDASLEA
ncbi:MAG: DUF2069 domain-containing protein [Pseudomonadales bacterium]|nr:DUF2069 domain-containing protein [Pseudomonadales bacterium]MCP5184534.1 DUF2069 domain-containing protein [Pseudomonadales bacterium]